MTVLVVSRYLPNKEGLDSDSHDHKGLSDAEQRNDALDPYNHPRYRRVKILEELQKRSEGGLSFVTPQGPWKDLEPYQSVQSQGLIEFLSKGWDRWVALGPEGQDPLSTLSIVPSTEAPTNLYVSPPLIPGNVPLPRDRYQRPSKNVMGQVGYYCTDTCTPIFAELFEELRWDVAVLQDAITALAKHPVVYALATHPGHHAAFDSFGGYCYLNHAAFAARQMKTQYQYKKVAVLDVDYHAGNGTASIFYEDPSVLVISIHCHPDYDYPFHSGLEEDDGADAGKGATLNLPLLPKATWTEYRPALERAMQRVQDFDAEGLVVSLGLDTYKGDPCAVRRAGFLLSGDDYVKLGKLLGSSAASIPTLFIQEGGYKMDSVPKAAADVLSACAQAKDSY